MKRRQITNISLLLLLALLLFSPLGFHLKVWVNRVLSFNPTPVEERKQEILSSYAWRLVDREGSGYDLSHAKGKVVFINIWASWCPPCVAEMPDLQLLYKDYNKKVVFLFIARDKKERVGAFMEENQYDFPIFYELGSSPRQLSSNSLPTTYILDRQGKIIVSETGAAAWNSKATRAMLDELVGS